MITTTLIKELTAKRDGTLFAGMSAEGEKRSFLKKKTSSKSALFSLKHLFSSFT